jgi:hypothetical protein
MTLWGGLLTGTAPPSVRQHLRYHSFRDFCAFNVDAEKTAALSWERLAVLGRQARIEPGSVELFERVHEDEVQHEKLFALLADSLTADDRLSEGLSAEALAGRIGTIHPGFVPWNQRTAEARHVLGSGGRVSVSEGAASREEGLTRALDEAGLGPLLEARAKALGKQVAELRVAVKTSFMLGVHRGDPSMVVAPEALAALVQALRSQGVTNVAVLEAPTGYDRFYRRRTVAEVARYFGFQGDYRLVDAGSDQVPANFPRGMVPATISATWRDADVRIVLGKLRSHPVQMAMLGLSALEGLGMRADAFHFAERPASPEIAVVTLAHEYPPHFSVLDAWSGLPDGLAGMLGAKRRCGRARRGPGGGAARGHLRSLRLEPPARRDSLVRRSTSSPPGVRHRCPYRGMAAALSRGLRSCARVSRRLRLRAREWTRGSLRSVGRREGLSAALPPRSAVTAGKTRDAMVLQAAHPADLR